MVFQDSDLYKWLEAVAFSLETCPDPELEKLACGAIELIGAAQQADGYINTYYTLKEPEGRWTNLQHGHELYCAGHLIEAAVAYFNATGKRNLLDIAIRFADCIDGYFRNGEGYPGHQEIELALLKLYAVTGEERYLTLARIFIDRRGSDEPHYFIKERQGEQFRDIFPQLSPVDTRYFQAHVKPAEQRQAAGHSVRAVYMYSAMADLALELGDEEMRKACEGLYDNITQKQMYITGAIGSTSIGEAFTTDYDLPNDLVYGETCASIGLMMFCRRMNALTGGAEYIDILERALYNTVLAGMSLSGTEFFYVNPLEADPARISQSPDLTHVKIPRQKWFDCSCCPTNISRTVMGLGEYIYAATDDGLVINLYCSGSAEHNGRRVEVTADYPYGGEVAVKVSGGRFKLYMRIPGKGYDVLERDWQGDVVKLTLDMQPKIVYTSPKVGNNNGKAAVMRGPLVYCAEQADNGENLGALTLKGGDIIQTDAPDPLPPQTAALTAAGCRLTARTDDLYSLSPPDLKDTPIKLIPYFLWANRGVGEMRVFFNYLI
jgi:hypothetical protein